MKKQIFLIFILIINLYTLSLNDFNTDMKMDPSRTEEEKGDVKGKKENVNIHQDETKTLFWNKWNSLNRFSKRVFRENLQFSTKRIVTPDEYILSIGDILIIKIIRDIAKTYSLKIDSNGSIFLPEIGTIYAENMNYLELKKTLNNKLSKIYKDYHLDVRISKVNDIQIFILGEVTKPGKYIISPFTSFIQLILSTSGIEEYGSVRKIKLLRENKVKFQFDLYGYIKEYDFKDDVLLKNNDVIVIETAKKIVAVCGAVPNECKYELLENENLNKLIYYIGRLLPNTDKNSIYIRRLNPVQKKVELMKFNIHDDTNVKLFDGDIIFFQHLNTLIANYVYINIDKRIIPYTDDFSLKKYISENKPTFSYLNYNYVRIERYNTPLINIIHPDRKPDKILSFNINDYLNKKVNYKTKLFDRIIFFNLPDYTVQIKGNVIKPNSKMSYVNNLKVADLINVAGGLAATANIDTAYIIRNYKENLNEQIFFSPKKALNYDKEHNLNLEPYDVVIILKAKDKVEFVKINLYGEFTVTDKIMVPKGTTLGELLEKNNIFKSYADLYTAKFLRNDKRIVIDFTKTDDPNSTEYNFILQNKDSITAYPKSPIIYVSGEVYNKVGMAFVEGKGYSYYIKNSGGFTPYADTTRIFIQKGNGETVISDLDKYIFRPGDEIVVPRIKEDYKEINTNVSIKK